MLWSSRRGDGGSGKDDPEREPTRDDLAYVWDVAYEEARRSGVDHATAEDIAQVVTLRLWLGWGKPSLVDARCDPIHWRNTIRMEARRRCSDDYRAGLARRRREAAVADLGSPPLPRPGVIRASPFDAWLPESDVQLFARELLIERIPTLPEPQRIVAKLRLETGLSQREISKALEISRDKVRWQLDKALSTLRSDVAGWPGY